MKKYKFVYILLLALWLAACAGSPQPTATPAAEVAPTSEPGGRGTGDTLRIVHYEAPDILNPHLSSSIKDWEPSRIIYEPLASFDQEGNLIPILAAEIPSVDNGGLAADGKSVTWKLRQDVKWSDGEPFTADDVLFTYEFVSNPDVAANSAGTYDVIQNIEVIDDYTVKINFKNVTPGWSSPFVGLLGVILPRHQLESYNGSNAKDSVEVLPVGTGPYQVMEPGIKPQEVLFMGTQLIETNKTVFEPNPYFREEDKPYFSRIEWRGGGTIPEAARLVMEDGWADFAYSLDTLSPEEQEQLKDGPEGQLIINPSPRVDRLVLNHTDPNRATANGERSSLEIPHPFFGDKQVRQAFAHAIDRESIAALYGLAGQPTFNNLVAPPQYNSPNVFYDYDLEKAAALLDEAGWVDSNGDGIRDKDGVKMKVVYQSYVSTAAQETQQIIKEDLESIGVEVELKIVDSSIMFSSDVELPDNVRRFNADLQEFYRANNSPDPSGYMQLWTCGQIPQKANNWTGRNYERWCSPEYDALYRQSTTELDPEKRRQIFIQINDLMIEDVAMVPMVYLSELQGVSRDIEGIELTPWDRSTWNIKDWRRVSP